MSTEAVTTEREKRTVVPGWGRSVVAGALVGLVLGVVLAVVDPLMMAGCRKTPTSDLVHQIPFSVAVLLPIFLLTGILGGFLLCLTRRISPVVHRLALWIPFLGWIALTFGYGTFSGIGPSASSETTRVKSTILTVVIAAVSYVLLYGLARLLVRRSVRRKGVVTFLVVLVLWGGALGWAVVDRVSPIFPAAVSSSTCQKPNVLLIVLDTVRVDHMSCYGYHRKTTPRIDAFATSARIYRDVLSPGSWTIPSHASFFTGLPESAHGADWTHQSLDLKFDTLAERLKAVGYQTVGFSSNPILSPSRRFDQGFDVYDVIKPGRTLGGRTIAELFAWIILDDREILSYARPMHERLAQWFRKTYRPDKPFFIFLNYIEPHGPYLPMSHALEWASEEVYDRWKLTSQSEATFTYMMTGMNTLSSKSISELETLYDEEILYTDGKVGELLDFLHANGLDRNTLTVITSDHGELFGEHHLMSHHYSVYEPLVRVPFILRWDGRVSPGEETTLVQSHDLYPTILEAAEVEWEKTSAHNCHSLLQEAVKSRRGFCEYLTPSPAPVVTYSARYPRLDFGYFLRQLRAVQHGPMKLIQPSPGLPELYDLSKDPLETSDLAATTPGTVKDLQDVLEGWLQGFEHYKPPVIIDTDRPLPQDIEDLRGLGYIK